MDAPEVDLGATWLASRYQIAGLRARGAFCLVYQGQDAVLQRPVAIKAPLAGYSDYYRSTLELTKALAHPAFLSLYDVVEQGATIFLAYEFVDGRPLQDYVTAGLPLRRALTLMLQVARAIAYAHAHGVAHGDLTPAAILIDRSAQARVMNVGMPPDAAYFDDVSASAHASGIADSPDATEAELAERPERLDTWAVAAILWQLITDSAGSDASGAQIRTYRDETPDKLRDILARALHARHAEALATAPALVSELAALEEALSERGEAHREREEPIPPAIAAIREANERATRVQVGSQRPSRGEIHWRESEQGGVSPTATTGYGAYDPWEAAGLDGSATLPSDDAPIDAQIPRLRLPSRKLAETNPRFALPERVAAGRAVDSTVAQPAARASLSGWIWALIAIAVFAICYLAGFFLITVIPR